jgi:signal transduction histidine kinase
MAETAQAAAAPPQGRPKHQRHLKNYLLDKGLQLRFTLIIVAISATLTSGLGWVVMSKAHEASRVVEVRAMDPTDEMAQQLAAQFAHNDKVMLAVLVAFGLLMSVVLSAYGIVLTHKIAGPLFKVTMYLDRMKDGKLGQVYNLRKGDELVEFFAHFKAAHDAVRARTEADIVLYDKAIAAMGTGALCDELKDSRDKKVESLK